eukprot:3279608-Prymnesium_polylepis.2
MVTSDFADSVGVIPFCTMAAIGSATLAQDVAYGRCNRYQTWDPRLNRCNTRCARCLRITPRASSHVAWSVVRSGSVQRRHITCDMACVKGLKRLTPLCRTLSGRKCVQRPRPLRSMANLLALRNQSFSH